MPNKDGIRAPAVELKAVVLPTNGAAIKSSGNTIKAVVSKCPKDAAMSPGTSPSIDAERTELLGSLTTQQQQRTSARVIKKLRLEPPTDREKRPLKKDGTDDLPECDTPNKIDEKELKFPTVKQRMPKALWSTDEKKLFFEALNEYGKDFDAVTAYICAKMKKKGMPDSLKTKTQVSHFYYRTWHKLSKHVHFDENVKKVAQELYALINYGELRKKLVSVSEKTCARLGEMVLCGSIVVRARGRNVRVRTPMCRALRRLNQITEVALGARVCGRAQVCLRARSAGAWARVLAAAHNPRAALALPLRARLGALLAALHHRWGGASLTKLPEDSKYPDELQKDQEDYTEVSHRLCEEKEFSRELGNHLNLETDRVILEERTSDKRLALHLGPRPDAQIHLPVVRPSEQLSSQKICFSSYLERMGTQRDKDGGAKIRTPKRTRKDSNTEKEKEVEQKKIKIDDPEKLINIEETAIDGIELMASYKSHQEDEEKPSTEDEKEREMVEEDGERDIPERDKDITEKDKDGPERDKDMLERDKDMSEKEKDSFSEMEDDEKYNKSDTDNESDHGKEKSGKDTKFKNLKVKFRIRPKKRGGSIYTLVMENPEEPKAEEPAKVGDEAKPDIDVDLALRQIRKGWSVYDAGDLTIGDLYLMFGSRSKLELDYWWAEPTPPLPQPVPQKPATIPEKDKINDKKEKSDKVPDKSVDKSDKLIEKSDKLSDKVDKVADKLEKLSDKGVDFVEEEKERARESDNDILSPKNTYSQDSNDGMSGDERKCEQLASPDHKSSSSSSGTFKLASKLINRPQGPPPPNGFALLSDRLKRLLALAGNPHVTAGARAGPACHCGHVCTQQRKQLKPQVQSGPTTRAEEGGHVFRAPPPIAPRPDAEVSQTDVRLEGVPRWRRGRPRVADRRVVVQRLLPLLPKLPAPEPVPVKITQSSQPVPPRILPKPPSSYISDLSFFYVLSESNGQFYFHDGDRRIPITPLPGNGEQYTTDGSNHSDSNGVKSEEAGSSTDVDAKDPKLEHDTHTEPESEQIDVTPDFLPSESMSLSPSRLLHDAEGWLDGSGHDFSLSSFLGHLEGRPQPDLAVDSQLHSLMAESSVDYVAKFADLAAEVTNEPDRGPDELP